MRYERGDATVGDVGIPVTAELGETLTGLNIDFVFTRPDGSSFTRDVSSVSGTVATYNTVSGDLDMSGDWRVYAKNANSPYHYIKESGHKFRVRPDPQDMAKAR